MAVEFHNAVLDRHADLIGMDAGLPTQSCSTSDCNCWLLFVDILLSFIPCFAN